MTRDMSRPEALTVSELVLDETVERIPVPWGGGNNWMCPSCEQVIPPRKVRFLGKPPKYAHVLNNVIQCSNMIGTPPRSCGYILSPASEVLVIRR